MQNIETVMNSFEERMREAKGERTGTRELENVTRTVRDMQRDVDKIREAVNMQTEPQQQ